mgnify:FL=1
MSISTIKQTNKDHLTHYEGYYTIEFDRPSLRFDIVHPKEGHVEEFTDTFPSFCSPDKKILLSLNIGMYNFYYTCVPAILLSHREQPDATLLLDSSGVTWEDEKSYYKFLKRFLDDLGIKYIIEDMSKFSKIYINNFYSADWFTRSEDELELLYKAVMPYVKNPSVRPFRTVYISRGKVEDRTFKYTKPGASFAGDNRILDEEVLEKFFIDNGVEVIYPEDIPDFADQINYFYETKTLISLTSSGIANSLFMKPGGTILEIVTPLLQALGNPFDPNNPVDVREDIHHIYNAMAYNKNHYYLSIQNHDRQSQTIINKMLNHDSFSSLVRNNK